MSVEEVGGGKGGKGREETPAPGAGVNTVSYASWELVQVDRARVAAAAIVAVAIDSRGGTFFPVGANGQGVAIVGNRDRKSTRLNSSHVAISYAVFCLKKKR